MTHATEEDLVLYYYGEDADPAGTARHLESCAECRAAYGALQRTLNLAGSLPVPDPGGDYGARVWGRLRPALTPRMRLRWWHWHARRWAAAAAFALLLVAAFIAGRYSPRPQAPQPVVRDRVLLVAVGDYLERSQMVLLELENAGAQQTVDISAERERAGDLVSETRLYRQTAAASGETDLADILDQLEPVLLDIARGPARVSAGELEHIRRRIESGGILFKVRVLGSRARERGGAAPL